MTRSHSPLFTLLGAAALFLSSCTRPAPVATSTASVNTPAAGATATAPTPHAAEIRFALVGTVTSPNVWALFDAKGYSYNNYAVRISYWPRLYHLTIPDGRFEPQAAAGMPSPVQQEGGFFTATVPLRTDLKWTDGSPFTADDVAFTVNTAVAFQLGFDWHAYYDPSYIDHAQALDAHTVKFFFKKAPNVAVWQYGALQGPVVQREYWAPKIAASGDTLPGASQLAQIDTLNTQVANLQKSINDLIVQGSTASGERARQLQTELRNQENNLDGLRNALSKAHDAVDGDMQAARESLYAIEASGEPTLGTWVPAGESNGTWTNSANPSHPFASPDFDRAVYMIYPDEASAAAALKNGKVNAVLEPDGISSKLSAQGTAGISVVINAGSPSNFLVVNPNSYGLADPSARRALDCSLDRLAIAKSINAEALATFIWSVNHFWFNPAGVIAQDASCAAVANTQQAVRLLQHAGYTWQTEPAGERMGVGLTLPTGQPFPPAILLASNKNDQGLQVGKAVANSAQYLGIPLSVQPASAADIRYAVFNSHNYDMALFGWRLSAYPGYLCEWFGDGNPFGYNIPQVRADCAALSTTTDLDEARQLFFEIQSVLAQDPPFIPLFSGVTYDATRGIVYSFDHVLNGLSGVYGAPELAIPAEP